jgi:hypothetical protein
MLRVTGIESPPHHYDEVVSMTVLLRMLKNNSLDPHWFAYPQQPWFYINFVSFKIYTLCIFFWKGMMGSFSTESYNYIVKNLHNYYILSRLINVCFSTLSVFMIFRLVLLFTKDKTSSLLASVILAFAPLPNYFAKFFVRVEELAIPFVLLIICLLLKYKETKDKRFLYFCAILSSFVTSIKWPFMLILLPLFLVFIIENRFKPVDRKNYKFYVLSLFVLSILFFCLASLYSIRLESTIKPLAEKMIYSRLLPQHEQYIVINTDKTPLITKSLDMILYGAQRLLFILSVFFLAAAAFFITGKDYAMKFLGILFDKTMICLVLTIIVSFMLFAPFLVLNPLLVLYQLSRQAWGDFNFLKTLYWYLANPLSYGIGNWLLSCLSLFGFCAILIDKELKNSVKIILLLFPVTYYLYLSLPGLRWDRWMLPLIPFQSAYISFLFFKVTSNKTKDFGMYFWKGLVFALVIIGLFGSLKTSIHNDYLFTHYDQHKLIKFWIRND